MSTKPISIVQHPRSPDFAPSEWKKAEKPFRFIDRDLVHKTTAVFINVKPKGVEPVDMTLAQYCDILHKYDKHGDESPQESERSTECIAGSPKPKDLEEPVTKSISRHTLVIPDFWRHRGEVQQHHS